MRNILLAAASVLVIATSAGAQTPPAAPPAAAAQPSPTEDPVKLALARDLLDASGGRQAVEARMDRVYAQMGELMKPWTGGDAGMANSILSDIKTDLKGRLPQLIDVTVAAYAKVYTEQELRDYIAWLRSPTGRAILAKTGPVQEEVLRGQMPIMQAMMSTLVERVLDRVCAEKKCTPAQRKQLDQVMGQMMGRSKS